MIVQSSGHVQVWFILYRYIIHIFYTYIFYTYIFLYIYILQPMSVFMSCYTYGVHAHTFYILHTFHTSCTTSPYPPSLTPRLIETAQSPSTSLKTLSLISSLLSNLYKSRGPEGKITPLGSGILDLTIKLLQSRDPLPVSTFNS